MDTLIEVVCGIVTCQGRILATRLAPHRKNAGQFEFPGGKVENREELEEALHRELKEELGLDVQVHHLFHTVEEPGFILHAFFCTATTTHVSLTDHDQALWLEAKELLGLPFVKADRVLVEKLVNGNI